MTQKKKTQQQRRKQAGVAELARRHRAIVAVSAVGAVAAGLGTALGLGWFDRFLTKGNAEHEVPDLAADAPVPGTTRAPEAFRPDPTAPVPASERDGLRPATGPSPTLSADRGEVANQTGAANG